MLLCPFFTSKCTYIGQSTPYRDTSDDAHYLRFKVHATYVAYRGNIGHFMLIYDRCDKPGYSLLCRNCPTCPKYAQSPDTGDKSSLSRHIRHVRFTPFLRFVRPALISLVYTMGALPDDLVHDLKKGQLRYSVHRRRIVKNRGKS